MARYFDVTPSHMSVALTSYLLSLAVLIPGQRPIADRFGARTVFSSAIVVFTLSSVVCAQAHNLARARRRTVVAGRGRAMMIPVGRLVLLRSVDRADLVSAMSWFLVPGLIGPILGPPVGGLIVAYLDWRWIFYINVPIGVLGVVLTWLFIQNTRPKTRSPFDVWGFALSGVSLACLLLASKGVAAWASPRSRLRSPAPASSAGRPILYYALRRRPRDAILDLEPDANKTFPSVADRGFAFPHHQGARNRSVAADDATRLRHVGGEERLADLGAAFGQCRCGGPRRRSCTASAFARL